MIRPRRVLGVLLAALFSFGAASCLGVLDLDGYASAPVVLCDLLERCYGEAGFAKCQGHVSSQLAVATAEGKESFLEGLSKCLVDCKSARRCLDMPPICRNPRQSCTTNEQCCGFSGGLAVCSRQSCCQTTGTSCKSDVDCCTGKCEGDPPTCGGTPCVVSGEPCAESFECCSGVCLASGVCSEDTCFPDGFSCMGDVDCCSGLCAQGTCSQPPCTQNDAPCLGDGECCNAAGCDETLGICGDAGCLPLSAPCSPTGPDPCCGDLFCKPGLERCVEPSSCTEVGQNCGFDDECCTLHCQGTCQCANDGEGCYESYTCCSGVCINGQCGQCRQEGSPCSKATECCAGICNAGACCKNSGCNHSICQPGEALTPTSCSESAVEIQCIRAICANDPYCCCGTWDGNCVGQVAAVCGLSCPAGP
ncbi:MAG TPA: hypothetical protein VM694_37980 [Polyangium sp.]|nr:hypothetical protein [Polyangium sp.]